MQLAALHRQESSRTHRRAGGVNPYENVTRAKVPLMTRRFSVLGIDVDDDVVAR